MTMFTIVIGKTGDSYDFNAAELSPASTDYLLEYGLKQSLNDVHAGVARKAFATDDEFVAAVREKVSARVDQIKSGNVPESRVARVRKAVKAVDMTTDQLLAELAARGIVVDPTTLTVEAAA